MLSNSDLEILREHRIQGVRRIAEMVVETVKLTSSKTPTNYDLLILREQAMDLLHHTQRAVAISAEIVPTDKRREIEDYAKSN
jgi:muramidase (phage lysozyme)